MAYYERSELRDKVIEYLDGRTDLNSKINSWLNDTRRDLAGKYDKGFAYLYTEATATASAGTARYALPGDYYGHLNLFIGDKKLVRLAGNEFDNIHGTELVIDTDDGTTPYLYTTGSSQQDEPDYYIDRGVEFDLYPTPNGTYTLLLRYYKLPTAWSADSDSDYISKFHPEAIIFGAAWRGAVYLEDEAKKKDYKEQYEEQVDIMRKKEKSRQSDDLPRRIKTWKDFSPIQFKRLFKFNN